MTHEKIAESLVTKSRGAYAPTEVIRMLIRAMDQAEIEWLRQRADAEISRLEERSKNR